MNTEPDPPLDHIWRTGESVRITYAGRTVLGKVILASSNGRSLALEFDAMLGGWPGGMPVLWDDATASFRDLGPGLEVRISKP